MKKTKAPQATASPKVSGVNIDKADRNDRRPGTVFFLATMDMTWQLALVVLIPIVGGYELDKHFKLTPTLTIIGFVLAMIGTFAVIKRTLATYNNQMTVKSKEADK